MSLDSIVTRRSKNLSANETYYKMLHSAVDNHGFTCDEDLRLVADIKTVFKTASHPIPAANDHCNRTSSVKVWLLDWIIVVRVLLATLILPATAAIAVLPSLGGAPLKAQPLNDSTLEILRLSLYYLKQAWSSAGRKSPKVIVARRGQMIDGGCIKEAQDTALNGSYYCPASGGTIVFDVDELEILLKKYGSGAIMYAVFHEFAHHIQRDRKARLVDPLHEQQADCYAGAMLFSSYAQRATRSLGITKASAYEMISTAYGVGGGKAHGSGDERAKAFVFGAENGMVACDIAVGIKPNDEEGKRVLLGMSANGMLSHYARPLFKNGNVVTSEYSASNLRTSLVIQFNCLETKNRIRISNGWTDWQEIDKASVNYAHFKFLCGK